MKKSQLRPRIETKRNILKTHIAVYPRGDGPTHVSYGHIFSLTLMFTISSPNCMNPRTAIFKRSIRYATFNPIAVFGGGKNYETGKKYVANGLSWENKH